MSCVFVKQKTAYERRISDWSSDVCASDLVDIVETEILQEHRGIDPDDVERQPPRLVGIEIERRRMKQQLAAAEGPASALDADAVVAEQPIFDLAVDHGDAGVDLLDLRDLSRRRLEPDQIVEAERRRQPRPRTEPLGQAGVGGRAGAAAGDPAPG